MQITEKLSDGLRREIEIVIKATDLENKLKQQLTEMKDKVHLKGFRPGKVPFEHLRRMYGKSMMGDIIQKEVSSGTDNILKEREERPAFQPQIKMTEDEKEIESILDGRMDLAYTMYYEVLPHFELADFSKLKAEKPVAAVEPAEIDKGIDGIVESSISYQPVERVAKLKDRLTLDFIGKLDGEAFEGGSAEDAFLILGNKTFIDGFEDGLIGAKAGAKVTVEGHFPDSYGAKHLAGKTAQFDVTVKEVAEPVRPVVDDAFAKTVGFENLVKLREAVEGGVRQEQDGHSRERLKKNIMDALDVAHSFELPPSLVDNEFDAIWEQINHEMGHLGKNFGDEGEDTEVVARSKYRKIAERRVRLGLVLARVAENNKIGITNEEMNAALSDRLRRFPGQEQQVVDFYRNNPSAIAELRAPILENKVIDFLTELMQISEKAVSRDELIAMDEEDI